MNEANHNGDSIQCLNCCKNMIMVWKNDPSNNFRLDLPKTTQQDLLKLCSPFRGVHYIFVFKVCRRD